jgi:hypothetical protein
MRLLDALALGEVNLAKVGEPSQGWLLVEARRVAGG